MLAMLLHTQLNHTACFKGTALVLWLLCVGGFKLTFQFSWCGLLYFD
jgi:hypothetical protein